MSEVGEVKQERIEEIGKVKISVFSKEGRKEGKNNVKKVGGKGGKKYL